MVPQWLTAFLFFLIEAVSARRDAQVKFLKLQVELLQKKLNRQRVILSPEDRQRLLKLGAEMNHQVDDLIGIVSVKTYKRWLREEATGRNPGAVGRCRCLPPSLRELILRLARENTGWGVRRIIGELQKLGLPSSRSTVRRVLVEEKVLPDPDRRAPKGVVTPWRTFVAAHLNTMVACDFFCKTIWTPMGTQVAYVLAFIHLESRRVFLSPSTYNPTGEWMQQQARNATMWMQDEGIELRFLVRDRDTKFTEGFDEHFRVVGEEIVRTPYQSPIANCFAESWIGSLKRECLNHFFCFSLGHLDYITQIYAQYHNALRPHQSLGNIPPRSQGQPPASTCGPIRCKRMLGGLLNHYYRKAA